VIGLNLIALWQNGISKYLKKNCNQLSKFWDCEYYLIKNNNINDNIIWVDSQQSGFLSNVKQICRDLSQCCIYRYRM
jgi:hypothetical protein